MISVSDEDFEAFVAAGMDAIPQKYIDNLNNVAFVTQDRPTDEQRIKLKLGDHQSLYGLYEGVPLTKRGSSYNLVLPDKITIFKEPMEMNHDSLDEVKEQVRHTVWHEVAHYYGLNHEQIHKLERPKPKTES
jgi:predicted Zn-dependent protease with MMP-like domain